MSHQQAKEKDDIRTKSCINDGDEKVEDKPNIAYTEATLTGKETSQGQCLRQHLQGKALTIIGFQS